MAAPVLVSSVCLPPQALRPELLGQWPTSQQGVLGHQDACKTPSSGAELPGRTNEGFVQEMTTDQVTHDHPANHVFNIVRGTLPAALQGCRNN
ncbi:hypothetical protein E2C01_039558 [Portunus trituberculatus]|uniref:Uncharacterized protein n=1 Tax=Portunus trituberculatus TaxID=210409 RepID=A0A5B7FH54_PORTR|nr:hypothetical protein [Portunus trituberculatus]